MAKSKEARLKQLIIKRLNKIPGSYWERVEQVSIRGTPDIVGCFLGRSYWIEVKTQITNTPSKRERLQLYKLKKAMEANAACIVMTETNWKMICRRLETIALSQKKQEQ